MPTRSSTSARPIASAAACRSTSAGEELVRTRGGERPSRCPDHAWASAVPERRPGRGAEMAASRAADQGEPRALLVYGTALVQWRRRHAGPAARLCLCQPRRRAGACACEGHARAARPAYAASDRQKALVLAHVSAESAAPTPRPRSRKSRRAACKRSRPSPRPGRDETSRRSSRRAGGRRTGRLAHSARRVLPARRRRSAVPARRRQGGAGRARSLLCRCRSESPACRSARSPARPPRLRLAASLGNRLLPGPGQVASAGTSRGGARPGPTARHRGRGA